MGNSLTAVASDCLILAGEHTYDAAEKETPGSGGSAMFMQEECDEDYDDVRLILIGRSPYNEYRQKEIIKSFMKANGITKQEILKYREDRKNGVEGINEYF